jgi:hypothetical protein
MGDSTGRAYSTGVSLRLLCKTVSILCSLLSLYDHGIYDLAGEL